MGTSGTIYHTNIDALTQPGEAIYEAWQSGVCNATCGLCAADTAPTPITELEEEKENENEMEPMGNEGGEMDDLEEEENENDMEPMGNNGGEMDDLEEENESEMEPMGNNGGKMDGKSKKDGKKAKKEKKAKKAAMEAATEPMRRLYDRLRSLIN